MENPERIDNLLEALGDLRVGDLDNVSLNLALRLRRRIRGNLFFTQVDGHTFDKRLLDACSDKIEMIKYVQKVAGMDPAGASCFVEDNAKALGADRLPTQSYMWDKVL